MQHNEHREQGRLITWSHKANVRALLPGLKWLHHSPNGGQRTGFTGGQMKALGTKPGFPDLVLPVRTDQHPGLAIEMKTDTGRTSPEQDAWLAHLASQGWATHVCRSADEARAVLCLYLGLDSAQAPPL